MPAEVEVLSEFGFEFQLKVNRVQLSVSLLEKIRLPQVQIGRIQYAKPLSRGSAK